MMSCRVKVSESMTLDYTDEDDLPSRRCPDSILLRRMWDKFFRVSVLYRSDFKFTNISLLVAVEAIKDVLTPNE